MVLLCICGWLVERLLTIEGMLENDCGVGREWSLEEHSAENDRKFEKKAQMKKGKTVLASDDDRMTNYSILSILSFLFTGLPSMHPPTHLPSAIHVMVVHVRMT